MLGHRNTNWKQFHANGISPKWISSICEIMSQTPYNLSENTMVHLTKWGFFLQFQYSYSSITFTKTVAMLWLRAETNQSIKFELDYLSTFFPLIGKRGWKIYWIQKMNKVALLPIIKDILNKKRRKSQVYRQLDYLSREYSSRLVHINYLSTKHIDLDWVKPHQMFALSWLHGHTLFFW